ncbi:hypothetical protein LCGC14_3023560, partial [marine sediment metagenome]
FDSIHKLTGFNGSFPVLYTYQVVTISRNNKIFRPIVLPLYMAKKLVYNKPLKIKKSKMTIAPGVLTQPMYAPQIDNRVIPGTDIQILIDIDLSADTSGIIRFTRSRESQFLQEEQAELNKMNKELGRDLEDVMVGDRARYLERGLGVFNMWRKETRRIHAGSGG